MQRKIMPDIVNKQSISALKPDNTVYEAATMMAKVNVAAIVVEDDKGLMTGIVTERDLTRRVVAKGLDAKKTPITDIMTANPDTLAPDDSAGDALELMQARHFRHLPVVEELWSPLAYVLPLQLFTYYLSLARGTQPDLFQQDIPKQAAAKTHYDL